MFTPMRLQTMFKNANATRKGRFTTSCRAVTPFTIPAEPSDKDLGHAQEGEKQHPIQSINRDPGQLLTSENLPRIDSNQ